jgi:hypothetical protein
MERVVRNPVSSGKEIESAKCRLLAKISQFIDAKNSVDKEEKALIALRYLIDESANINKSVWTGVFLELFDDYFVTDVPEDSVWIFRYGHPARPTLRVVFKRSNGEILFTNMEREADDESPALEGLPYVEDVPLLFDDELKYPIQLLFGDTPMDDFRFWTVWGMKPLFEALTGDHESFAYRNAIDILTRILTYAGATTDDDEYEIPVTDKDFRKGVRLVACGGSVILIKDSPDILEMALEVIFVPAVGYYEEFMKNTRTYVTA